MSTQDKSCSKIALVTGGNSGVGYETALGLASAGHKVVIAGRNEERMTRAMEDVRKVLPHANIESHVLDLGSIGTSLGSANAFLAKYDHLDVLVLHAGIAIVPFALTPDGYEVQFATNHLGHFAFCTTLLPLLKSSAQRSGDGRILIVGSKAMRRAEWNYNVTTLPNGSVTEPLTMSGIGSAFGRYGRSKLANAIFAYKLDRECLSSCPSLRVNLLDPGFIANTGLSQGDGQKFLPSWSKGMVSALLSASSLVVGQSPKEGAATTLYLATSPRIKAENQHGMYFNYNGKGRPPVAKPPNPIALDQAEQDRLWEFSQECIDRAKKD